MPKFIVPVSWTTFGHFIAEGDTLEDAKYSVLENRDEKYPYREVKGCREQEIKVHVDKIRPIENS